MNPDWRDVNMSDTDFGREAYEAWLDSIGYEEPEQPEEEDEPCSQE